MTKAMFTSIENAEADVPNIMQAKQVALKRRDSPEEDDDDDDEFFDAKDQWDESISLAKWSSMELESVGLDASASARLAVMKVSFLSNANPAAGSNSSLAFRIVSQSQW